MPRIIPITLSIMSWNSALISSLGWSSEISNRVAKEKVARLIAERVADGDIIWAGSGSTAYLALIAIAEKIQESHLSIRIIPTSREIALTCTRLGIPTTSLFSEKPDWYFDGADEVDTMNTLIKGRWGALYQEKLLMRSSPHNYILVDASKYVTELWKKFPIPVEVFPDALHLVERELRLLGAHEIILRLATEKDWPIITESGGFILDTRYDQITPTLERDIKSITGVIESGLFQGYDVEVITG